jgi:hypothetical protein
MGILSGTRMSGIFKGSGPEVTNPPSREHNFFFSLAWIFGGIVTVLVPLIYRTRKMNEYKRMYNMWNWEEVKQYYEEQYAQQYQGNYQYTWEEMKGTWDVNQCKWWQFGCFPYYINDKGEPQPAAGWFPSWYSGWALSEEEREAMMENGQTSQALIFVYVWQILMFTTILIYGLIVIKQNRIVSGLVVALVVFANMSFLSMWMLADGSIITDGEYVQQSGFYGQFAVLMFITNFWYVLFGVIFSILFALRGHRMQSEKKKQLQAQDDANTSYKALEEKQASQQLTVQQKELGDDYVKII